MASLRDIPKQNTLSINPITKQINQKDTLDIKKKFGAVKSGSV